MSKVSFIIDIEKDIKNIYDKSTKRPTFGTNKNIDPKLIKICEGKSFEESRLEIKIYLKKIYNLSYLEIFKESVQKLWDSIEREFFEKMNSLMKRRYDKEIKGYITTIPICPYNPEEPSFMISLLNPLQVAMSICGHEIMHLYFHEFYWKEVEKLIGKEKTGNLKEALTVLLNLEFKELWLINDKGYEEHKELREFISKNWKEEKDFDKLLENCVKYLK